MRVLKLLIISVVACSRTTCGSNLGSDHGQFWTMCRSPGDATAAAAAAAAASFPAGGPGSGFGCPGSDLITNAHVPGTALVNLLANSTFSELGVDLDTVFVDDYLSRIPDINATGPEFYTFFYRTDLDISALDGDNHYLTLRGVNYRAEVFANGARIQPLPDAAAASALPFTDTDSEDPVGMFHRWTFKLPQPGLAGEHGGSTVGLAVLVRPPDYPGNLTCPADSTEPCGQGGDHLIAMNAATQQSSAGWDWIQGTPDRNTGIWDKVYLTSTQSPAAVLLRDPYLRTLSITDNGSSAVIEPNAVVTNAGDSVAVVVVSATVMDPSDSGNVVGAVETDPTTVEPGAQTSFTLPKLQLDGVKLWWPHTHGDPFLYEVRYDLLYLPPSRRAADVHEGSRASQRDGPKHQAVSQLSSPKLVHSLSAAHGVRTVTTRVDEATTGRVFEVNDVPIFLQGGNWITTDQFLRYADDRQRYWDEVNLHRDMGMNLIRVWGGGITERPEFYDACDRAGMLVMQEFWMTGDNNGRWAGSYDWPTDHGVYLRAAADMMLMVRGHASLLFLCGGNELDPPSENPSPEIASGLYTAVAELAPDTYLILSSMAPQNYSERFDPEYALAANDGNYGFNFDSDFYGVRNPGLTGAESVPIGFQPEIGAAATPSYQSLAKFLTKEALEAFPGCLEAPNDVWSYHKYENYWTNSTYDHVCAYGTPADARSYALHAALAQFTQYKALFEGFSQHMWEWYTAVLMWKSQSPWPALRGALYDYYLEQSGGYWGVRHALSSNVDQTFPSGGRFASDHALHVQLDLSTLRPAVINKGEAVESGSAITVTVTAFDLASATQVSEPFVWSLDGRVAARTVLLSPKPFVWPALDDPARTLFLELKMSTAGGLGSDPGSEPGSRSIDVGASVMARNHYWLNRGTAAAQDYSDLGAITTTTAAIQLGLSANVTRRGLSGLDGAAELEVEVDVTYERRSTGVDPVGIWCVLSLEAQNADQGRKRLLPTFWTDNALAIMPGAVQSVSATTRLPKDFHSDRVRISVSGWHVAPSSIDVRIDPE